MSQRNNPSIGRFLVCYVSTTASYTSTEARVFRIFFSNRCKLQPLLNRCASDFKMVTGNQQASRSRQNFRSGSSSIGRQKGSSATNNGYRTSRGLESGASRSGGGHRLLEGLPNDIRRRIPKKRLTLAIDYGTTFSSVSYNVRGFDEYEDSFHSRVTVNVRTVKNVSGNPNILLSTHGVENTEGNH